MMDGSAMTLETVLRAEQEMLTRSSPRFSDGRWFAVLDPETAAWLRRQVDTVHPREHAGAYVPEDEQHPPITATQLRRRMTKARA